MYARARFLSCSGNIIIMYLVIRLQLFSSLEIDVVTSPSTPFLPKSLFLLDMLWYCPNGPTTSSSNGSGSGTSTS